MSSLLWLFAQHAAQLPVANPLIITPVEGLDYLEGSRHEPEAVAEKVHEVDQPIIGISHAVAEHLLIVDLHCRPEQR